MAVPTYSDLSWAKSKMSKAQFSEIADKTINPGEEVKRAGTYIDLSTGEEQYCSIGFRVPPNTRFILKDDVSHLRL